MIDLSLQRLKEMVGDSVPCIPATNAETAAMAQKLIRLRALLKECANVLDFWSEETTGEDRAETEDLIWRIGEELK